MNRASAMLLSAALCAPASAYPQGYPGKPVRVITQFAAGAAGDILTRILTNQLADSFGQPVVVDNRPGAGGVVAAEAVARAAPDGYTLLVAGPGTQVVRVYLVRKSSFDPVRDFTPVTAMGDSPVLIVAHPSVPATSFRELIAYAKANPGKLSYGTSGVGSQHHLAGEQIGLLTGAQMVHVPYKAGAQALVDVSAGQLPLSYTVIGPAMPQIRAGKVRALAVVGDKRVPALPDVPAVTELLPGFEPIRTWVGLFGPAHLPEPVLKRVSGDAIRALTSAEGRAKVIDAGYDPIGNTPEEFAAMIAREVSSAGRIVKAANIQPVE